MGKGISLAELNRMHRSKNPVQPPRQRPKSSVIISEAQFKRELRQKLNQFEREHFRPLEQKQEPRLYLPLFFIGILGICFFSFFLFVTWEIFQVNRGNFYFWGYVFLVPLVIFHHDENWKNLGLIVLIIGLFYWLWDLPLGQI
jgi:hypothetical protein